MLDEPVQQREFVVCEDNYLVMLRTKTHKLVYYIGQDKYEFYDLQHDSNEQHNLWGDPSTATLQHSYLRKLLDFLATSTYFASGYKRTRDRNYAMRWHGDGDTTLHGASAFVSRDANTRDYT